MNVVQLPQAIWQFDPNAPLGKPGGFGAVFCGIDETGQPVAVKQLKITAASAAHRELRMADSLMNRDLQHVLPILDAGQDADSDRYYIIMPRADHSLQDELQRLGTIDDAATIDILSQIVSGLLEVPDITHRDLKPPNILFHEGRWKIADFGIARFVEESTSSDTLKGFLSLQYAAPEQIRMERATSATDIYSLGCIAYALLTGEPPFKGERHEIVEWQLHATPPPLHDRHLPLLRNLVTMMLRKPPQSRPDLRRAQVLLENCTLDPLNSKPGTGLSSLAQASAFLAESEAKADADLERQRSKQQQRRELCDEGHQVLAAITQDLAERVELIAPNALVDTDPIRFIHVKIGSARLRIERLRDIQIPIPSDAFPRSGWTAVTGVVIEVTQSQPYKFVWGGNLWYMTWGSNEGHRWYEALYMCNPLMSSREFQPFSVDNVADADLAAENAISPLLLASKPRTIDDEDADDFIQRWTVLLSKAATGNLTQPRRLPLD